MKRGPSRSRRMAAPLLPGAMTPRTTIRSSSGTQPPESSSVAGEPARVRFRPWPFRLTAKSSPRPRLAPSHNLRLWDAETARLVADLKGHTDRVRSVAFSPDGSLLAAAGSDCVIWLWEARSGKPVNTLSGHTDAVRKLCFSPDGRFLASASNDQTVRIWDIATSQIHWQFQCMEKCSAVAFAPDGSSLAVADEGGDVSLWNVETGDRSGTIHSDHDQLLALAFSPDGRSLVTAGSSRVIKLWDVLTRQEELALSGHAAQINGLAFSPDGHTLASCSHDGAVKLWSDHEQSQ